jgi:alanine dehydrogenase
MEFGVPKEVRDLEMRVGLTPAGVHDLAQAGHTVYIERGAGTGAGFKDDLYRQNGAQLVYSAAEAYGRADVVVKVTRPYATEHRLFRDGQAILSFFHLAVASPDLYEVLVERQITAIAYEMIQDADGVYPVLQVQSEVAGRLAPFVAGQLLMQTAGGRGILLSGIPGVPPAVVVIVGAGVLGMNAARAFLGVGAQVTVLDNDIRRLQLLDELYAGHITTMLANEYNLHRSVAFADVLVLCVRQPEQRAPVIITREMVRQMRPTAVLIDFAIDQGGASETSRPTTLRSQTYVDEDVIHHCVPNITAMVARTSSHALTNAALPFLLAIGRHGMPDVFGEHASLACGVNLFQGKIAHPALADALGVPLDDTLLEYVLSG